MICHLPGDPLHAHARHVLVTAKNSANSWFLKIRDLCLMYGLDHPLKLLASPPTKASFKKQVKEMIASYWKNIFTAEAAGLPSLCFFMSNNCSLMYPHPVWSTARTSFETRKATVLARMMSGRFHSEYLTRHWSQNKLELCQAETCRYTIGDLKHLLIHCPALDNVRARMWTLMFHKSATFPALLLFLQQLEKSPPKTKLQFLLDPTAFHDILALIEIFGQPALDIICYLTRTYVYYLYRQKQLLVGWWSSDNLGKNRNKKPNRLSSDKNNYLSIAGDHGVYHHSQEAATHRRPDFHDGWALSVVGPSDLLPEVNQHPCQDAAGEDAGDQLLQTAAVNHPTDQEVARSPQYHSSNHDVHVSSPTVFLQPYRGPAAAQHRGAAVSGCWPGAPPCLEHGGSGARQSARLISHLDARHAGQTW